MKKATNYAILRPYYDDDTMPMTFVLMKRLSWHDASFAALHTWWLAEYEGAQILVDIFDEEAVGRRK